MDCTAGGVVQCLDGSHKSFLDAESPDHLPQDTVPYSIEDFLEIYEIMEQVPLMLKVLLCDDPAVDIFVVVETKYN